MIEAWAEAAVKIIVKNMKMHKRKITALAFLLTVHVIDSGVKNFVHKAKINDLEHRVKELERMKGE